MKQQILIDTNILIGLEDNKVVSTGLAEIFRISSENSVSIVYHPLSIRDVNKDKNEDRKRITLSKLDKYSVLKNPASTDSDFVELVGEKNDHDIVDNGLLIQVYKGYVWILVTEDNGILKKASKLNIRSRVLKINECNKFVKDHFSLKIPGHPIIRHGSCRLIEKYLKSHFFDSFRNDYSNFDQWFETKCVLGDRECYFMVTENKLLALCLYNIEETDGHQIPGFYGKALKINSFKVSEDMLGNKVGELFIGKIIDLAIELKITLVYLTSFEKQEKLIQLFERFGFNKSTFINSAKKEELRLIKELDKSKFNASAVENSILMHPFYSDSSKHKKFVVPIQPKYRRILFKDKDPHQSSLFDADNLEQIKKEVSGNGIIKAYISKSKTKGLEVGSILLFYFSKEPMTLALVAVLDGYQDADSADQVFELATKRTVYSREEMELFLAVSTPAKVAMFRLLYYLSVPVPITVLRTLPSFKGNFQTITFMPESDYQQLKSLGYFDQRYIID
jgi:hypothetical protein